MLYQPMTDSQAEDAWIDAFMLLMGMRDLVAELVLSSYMYHLKRTYPGIVRDWARA